MTLGTWFRDYVYIPMGGNRCSKGRWILNTFTVWALTGIWHGANWTFIFWGLMYFVLLMFEKLTGFGKKQGFFMHVYTMLFVTLGWVVFRSDSLTLAFRFIGNMFGIHSAGFVNEMFFECLSNSWVILILSFIFSVPTVRFVADRLNKAGKTTLVQVLKSVLILVLFLVSVVVCIKATYNPFIYLNF